MGDEPVEAISAPDAAAATIDESSLRVEDLLPKRRQRASDDESEDEAHHGTHDKAGASSGRDHAVSAIENQTDFVPIGGDDLQRDDSSQVPGEAEGDDSQDAASDNEQEGEQEDAQQPAVQPPKPRQPYDVPTTGAFWLHDDRFSEAEAAAHQAKLAEDRVKAKAKEPEGKWAHDRFGVEDDADDNESHFRSRPNYRGLRGGRAGGRGRGSSSQAHHQDGMGMASEGGEPQGRFNGRGAAARPAGPPDPRHGRDQTREGSQGAPRGQGGMEKGLNQQQQQQQHQVPRHSMGRESFSPLPTESSSYSQDQRRGQGERGPRGQGERGGRGQGGRGAQAGLGGEQGGYQGAAHSAPGAANGGQGQYGGSQGQGQYNAGQGGSRGAGRRGPAAGTGGFGLDAAASRPELGRPERGQLPPPAPWGSSHPTNAGTNTTNSRGVAAPPADSATDPAPAITSSGPRRYSQMAGRAGAAAADSAVGSGSGAALGTGGAGGAGRLRGRGAGRPGVGRFEDPDAPPLSATAAEYQPVGPQSAPLPRAGGSAGAGAGSRAGQATAGAGSGEEAWGYASDQAAAVEWEEVGAGRAGQPAEEGREGPVNSGRQGSQSQAAAKAASLNVAAPSFPAPPAGGSGGGSVPSTTPAQPSHPPTGAAAALTGEGAAAAAAAGPAAPTVAEVTQLLGRLQAVMPFIQSVAGGATAAGGPGAGPGAAAGGLPDAMRSGMVSDNSSGVIATGAYNMGLQTGQPGPTVGMHMGGPGPAVAMGGGVGVGYAAPAAPAPAVPQASQDFNNWMQQAIQVAMAAGQDYSTAYASAQSYATQLHYQQQHMHQPPVQQQQQQQQYPMQQQQQQYASYVQPAYQQPPIPQQPQMQQQQMQQQQQFQPAYQGHMDPASLIAAGNVTDMAGGDIGTRRYSHRTR